LGVAYSKIHADLSASDSLSLLKIWKEASHTATAYSQDRSISRQLRYGTITFGTALTMERLFSPSTRLHDRLESQGLLEGYVGRREILQELNINVSTQEFLSAERAFTYAGLNAMLGNGDTIAWLTPHAAVTREDGRGESYWGPSDQLWCFSFEADGKEIVAQALSPEHLLEICDVVLRLLAASVIHSVILDQWYPHGALINAASLAYLMAQCQSLKALKLANLKMDENHCRVLGTFSRPDLEIVMTYCTVVGAGANALAEVLGRNQGPTKLDSCHIDNFVLANGLRGNSRLKSLRLSFLYERDSSNEVLLAIADALRPFALLWGE
jgi:hypothetical protein